MFKPRCMLLSDLNQTLEYQDATPKIDVDPETYAVRADGELLVCDPARELPLAQRYFLF